ncbi:SH2 domain-containing adapter protein B [Heterocephalus glaber]|uniref:SH2 domain-containing adapter protein B n=1 Tax=Heterocephalus glaber TaxID=10181 RepID=G5C1D2_HETGA|nr:SH2 domain-containing adapter protein B [Heterocephalus glaber]
MEPGTAHGGASVNCFMVPLRLSGDLHEKRFINYRVNYKVVAGPPCEGEFQRQESVWSQHKGIQLYDTPYEPEGQSVDSDSESTVSPRLRESKLPQDDDRPADEYDQPWEWNRVTIPALADAALSPPEAHVTFPAQHEKGNEELLVMSPCFGVALVGVAAQFNGNEKRQSSPSPSRDRRRQLRAPGGGFKPIKHGSPEFCGILGERVDPTVPLEKQIWYHGAISRGDAENLLRLCKECSYLVRNSQTSKHDYSLSLKSNQGFMHMKLAKTKEKYVLGQNSPPFDSVPEVIHYYTTRKLPIKGAEHLSLLYPVAVRTL